MPRLPHGVVITLKELQAARDALAEGRADTTLGFAASQLGETHDFGFLFPELQYDSKNLLHEGLRTRESLADLGRAMLDTGSTPGGSESGIPAAYTYFGQFVDHDIMLEAVSAILPELTDPYLSPLPLDRIESGIQNARTAKLDLDSVYGFPAPRVGSKMQLGKVTELGGSGVPFLRPQGKDDDNDLPREGRSRDLAHDRAALIGDPRNDENTIIAQLHVAFLRAHNALVKGGATFEEAKRLLRQHYQHLVLQDFLKRIADPQIVDDTIENGNRVYDPDPDYVFMPFEFSVAAYRFGHSMVRAEYNFNLNFQPAMLDQLFTFSGLSGQLGEFDTLPENWIIQWPNFVDVGTRFNQARRIDTNLVEPLFTLLDLQGRPRSGDHARLAVRNLLRGYLLRLPTGQAVARALNQKLIEVREIPVLKPNEIAQGAGSAEQYRVLRETGFLESTPLWYYVLTEAAVLGNGLRLGPVGSTIVAEVLVGLVRHSENSILHVDDWKPTLPGKEPDKFTLTDLLRFAGVL
jgi:hypothetical protein